MGWCRQRAHSVAKQCGALGEKQTRRMWGDLPQEVIPNPASNALETAQDRRGVHEEIVHAPIYSMHVESSLQ